MLFKQDEGGFYMQEQFELNVVQKNVDCVTSTVVVDVPRTAGRYEVHLAFFPNSKHYLLTIINFRNTTVYTHSDYGKPDFRYMLVEKGITRVDAQAIQQIVTEMSLKEIEGKLKRKR